MDLNRSSFVPPLVGALVMGVLSTFGDWVWKHYIPDGAVVPGVLHGMVIFAAFAALLAHRAGTRRAWKVLMPSLPLVGLGIAAAFYPVAIVTSSYITGLLFSWVAMWLSLAAVQRLARDRSETLSKALGRGLTAALTSGLAFWAVSGMWTRPDPEGPNYLLHLVYWTFAFLPGFVALLVDQPRESAEQAP